MAENTSSTQTTAQKFEAAALAVVSHLKQVLAQSDAEKLVEDLVQALADGIVAGVELASPPGIVSIEKMALPWLEQKGVAAADGLIHVLFAKLAAKSSTPAANVVAATPEGAAQAVNAL